MIAILLLSAPLAEPPVARASEPPMAWVTVSPTVPMVLAPRVGESVCVGSSCSAPGGVVMGIGAVRGLAGTTRPLFRPFRR